jgi:hypothetical protein
VLQVTEGTCKMLCVKRNGISDNLWVLCIRLVHLVLCIACVKYHFVSESVSWCAVCVQCSVSLKTPDVINICISAAMQHPFKFRSSANHYGN